MYVVIIEDRHANPQVEAFRTEAGALRRVKAIYDERIGDTEEEWPDVYAEIQEMNEDFGDGYYYSTEGDCVYAVCIDDPVD